MSDLRDKMDDLGWAPTAPRDRYDYLVFSVIKELVSEVERLKLQMQSVSETASRADRASIGMRPLG